MDILTGPNTKDPQVPSNVSMAVYTGPNALQVCTHMSQFLTMVPQTSSLLIFFCLKTLNYFVLEIHIFISICLELSSFYSFFLEHFSYSIVSGTFFRSRNFSSYIFDYTLNYSFYSIHILSFSRVPIIHSFIFYPLNLSFSFLFFSILY